MNNNVKTFLAFVAGAAAGSFAAWKLLEKKYKRIADEEIESVKEMFGRKMQKNEAEEKVAEEETKYGDVVSSLGYVKETKNEEVQEDMASDAKVYVISPEAFGEYGYDTVSLTYYADEILTYATDNKIIKNVDEVVGHNSLKTFGEYEDDSVFVRNENMKKDFEILLDTRRYSDIFSRRPHLVNDDDEQ